MKKISIAIPIYNEEKNLEKCIISLNNEIQKLDITVKTYLCLNGCEDDSENIAKKTKDLFPNLNIVIIKSEKGKLNAQEKIISKINDNYPIIFMDSDIELKNNVIKIILDELNNNKELIAVGAFPIAKKYQGLNIWKIFLDRVLNIRSRFPQAEISKFDVTNHHKLAVDNPQSINTNPNHESKSKVFFHGRLFVLKSKRYWNKPKKAGIVGDDSYLPDYIIYNYGINRIRIRYDSIVYFIPHTSIINHYKAYKRIYFDLKNLEKNYPEFKEIRKKSQLTLDWDYINELRIIDRIFFYIFSTIRYLEKLIFNLTKEKCPEELWYYKKK